MTSDVSLRVIPLPAPQSAVFDAIMAAQTDDAGRLEAAMKLAETSRDPATKAAAIFWTQLHFLRVADPDGDLSDVTTIEAAQARLDHLSATDPGACDRLRHYLKG